ncbi:MAG: hypothetical protein LQ349_007196, partial [Xanthoria aureola]
KPPFAQERRGIEDGYLKEVVLVEDESHLRKEPTVPDSDPGVPEHFMNQSPFQSPEADLPLISRKRRLGHENGNEAIRNTPSAPVPVSQNFTVQEIIEQDRAYFASRNDRPPYVKELSVQRQFTAVLADQDKRRSEHQIVAHARDWGGGFQYWIVNLDGQERIVDKVRGGQGGYRLRLWLGHQEYERGIEGEIVGFAPLPPKDDINGQVITRSEDGSVAQNVRQHTMPPRIRKQARHSESSARRGSNNRSRATSSPLARPDASQQSRSAPKARATKTNVSKAAEPRVTETRHQPQSHQLRVLLPQTSATDPLGIPLDQP